jgi:acetate kinase
MNNQDKLKILTINSGSSSLKFALYQMADSEELFFTGSFSEIGEGNGLFQVKNNRNQTVVRRNPDLPDHHTALQTFSEWLKEDYPEHSLTAIGHRIVHGGKDYTKPEFITGKLTSALNQLIPFAPDHLPHQIKAIESFHKIYPEIKQIACFDTSFHSGMPKIAKMFAVTRDLFRQGVQRYGFHGLSYEYILSELERIEGKSSTKGRLIIAHLGNGASMAAVKDGVSIDTTMGFTPAGGMMMSSRSGDLDPGILIYLLKEKHLDISRLNDLINQKSGLIGISGVSSDMKILLNKQENNPLAAEAITLFCYQARKFIGALSAVLGGIDELIFTGGIGENAPEIRAQICNELAYLGISVDEASNNRNAPVISKKEKPVIVRVIKTNEELMIARHTRNLIVSES